MLSRNVRIGSITLATALLGACGPTTDNPSTLQGIDVQNSNVQVSAQLRDRRIEALRIPNNTLVPKGFIVSLTDYNREFLRDLYTIVEGINTTERLSGMEGPNQEITMVAVGEPDHVWAELTRHATSTTGEAAAPFLARIDEYVAGDLWQQDWGEFAAVKLEGVDGYVHGVMDGGRGIGQRSADFFARIFKTPFINVSGGNVTSGNFGGNTEATHEGVLYWGDQLTDTGMEQTLRRLGNQNAVEIPSNWLAVGHVDEYSTFIPAGNECGGSLVVASPLDAFNIIAQGGEAVIQGWGVQENGEYVTAAGVRNALARFARPGATLPYKLSDMDTSRQPVTGTDLFVQRNLYWEQGVIATAVQRLRNASRCLNDVVTLPQIYTYRSDYNRAESTLGGATNMLVLRDHVVVPEPRVNGQYPPVQAFMQAIRTKLGQRLGGADKVHFIDTTPYHTRMGEIHCGTNVIREIGMRVQM